MKYNIGLMRKEIFTKISSFILFVVLISIVLPAYGGSYKWVDDKGVLHFSDTPPENPRGAAVEQVRPGKLNIIGGGDGDVSEGKGAVSTLAEQILKDAYSDKEESQKADVEMYMTSWCGYCKKAARWFRSKGIAFKEHNIEKDKEAYKRYKYDYNGRGVPLLVINGTVISGYNTKGYERALSR